MRRLISFRIRNGVAHGFQSALGFLLVIGTGNAVAQNTFPSTGNVGIGTTSPAANLDVEAPSGTQTTSIKLGANGAPTWGRYTITRTDNGSGNGYISFMDPYGGNTTTWGADGVPSMTLHSIPAAGSTTTLTLNDSSGNPKFTFDTIGGIGFPDGSSQSTAFIPSELGSTVGTTGWNGTNGIGGAINGTGGFAYGLDLRRWSGGANYYDVFAGQWWNSASSFYDFGVFENTATSNVQATTLVFDVAPIGVAVTGTGTFSGNVGIGTTTPGADLASLAVPPSAGTPILEVKGDIALALDSGGEVIFPDRTVQSTAWNGTTLGGDYAESVDVSGDRKRYEPGDVLVIDSDTEGSFLKSVESYSTSVSGIYSTRPGLVGRRQLTDRSHVKDEVPMAMAGIVPTKVCAESGPIRPGDLLVTSSRPGYAMKGTDHSRMLGAVIGKALGHLDADTGVIEVVVTLQ